MKKLRDEPTKIDTLKFESPINKENSFRQWNLSPKTTSIMELWYYKDNTAFIEWIIEELDLVEGIGLTFEIDPKGKRTLVDYDGVFAIPDQAMDLLERNGVDCKEMRESMAK